MDLPEIIGGKYRPRRVLGTGATGTVYAVEHAFTGDLLALKVMRAHVGSSADAMARFRREARAASQIRSQHVVRIFDADFAPELGGAPFLVMDLLEGSDLEQVSCDRPVGAEDVVEWLRQVALPLDKAHRIGIVHRDLKPENLFLTRLDDGTALVKILDFGIARIASESPGTTQSGQVFGTPLYMAPEQARGDPGQMGPATDLFALGQIAYRLLTGVAYRTGTSLAEMLSEILHEPIQAPSERGYAFGADFDRWFLRACHPEPARRFASAHEQVEALARALGLPAQPELTGSPSSSPDPRESLPLELRRSDPDSSRNALGSLRAMAVEKNGATSEKGAGMPTFTVSEEPKGGERSRKNGWRLAAVAVSVLAGVPLLVFAFSGARGPGMVAAPRPSACPVETTAAAVAPAEPPVVAIASPAPELTEVAVAKSPTTTTRPSERPPIRPARAVVARRGPVDDDPLSDQQ